MGYNSVVLVLNDALGSIARDFDFGKKVDRAIMTKHTGMRSDIESGGHINAASVVSCYHADNTALIAVGGNHASVVDVSFGNDMHHTEEGQERLLRHWADKMGYRLVKKTRR